MAGPAPVSALIHAATMVKAGVYMVARFLPIFYCGYWVGGFDEALSFFLLAAYIGAFTAFLTGTQAMVSLELKKALAYSTMSQIGYMMLSLGIAGLSPQALIYGYVAGIFHLISHALFKAALFLGSGTVIHGCKSIYMSDMGGLKRYMPITWFFMWIASLSLAGFPFLSGFWSKDAILLACLLAENYWLFALALGTAALTAFYSIRFMGLSFHGKESSFLAKLEREGEKPREANPLMWVPYGILASITVILGLLGPSFEGLMRRLFEDFFHHEIPIIANGSVGSVPVQVYVVSASVAVFLVGALPAYMLYVSGKLSPQQLIGRYPALNRVRGFFWDRWHIDSFYNKVFIDGMLKLRFPVGGIAERVMDAAYNVKLPFLMELSYLKMRRLQVGVLSYYVFYVALFMIILIISLLVVWPYAPA
jgi:NADH-quinone oxidoreductase subunit L